MMLRNTLNSANFTRLVNDLDKFNIADSVSKAGKLIVFNRLLQSATVITNLIN